MKRLLLFLVLSNLKGDCPHRKTAFKEMGGMDHWWYELCGSNYRCSITPTALYGVLIKH